MIRAVFDSNVIVSASGWRGDSYSCMVAMARRRVRVFASDWIAGEVELAMGDLLRRGTLSRDPQPLLNWFWDKAGFVQPVPLGKQRSRDLKDDPILATALTAGAKVLVSQDNDLLELEKPFGISIVTPRAFLGLLQR